MPSLGKVCGAKYGKQARIEALPGVLGNMGIRPFISGERGEQNSKTEGNRGTKAGTIENQDFDFGEQGKMPFFSGEQGNRCPSRAPQVGLWATISYSKDTHPCPILRDNSCKSYMGPVKITVRVLADDC